MKKDTIKPKSPNCRRAPRTVWRIAKQHLPKQERKPGAGCSRKPNRAVMNGLYFILWTGCLVQRQARLRRSSFQLFDAFLAIQPIKPQFSFIRKDQ